MGSWSTAFISMKRQTVSWFLNWMWTHKNHHPCAVKVRSWWRSNKWICMNHLKLKHFWRLDRSQPYIIQSFASERGLCWLERRCCMIITRRTGYTCNRAMAIHPCPSCLPNLLGFHSRNCFPGNRIPRLSICHFQIMPLFTRYIPSHPTYLEKIKKTSTHDCDIQCPLYLVLITWLGIQIYFI